MNARFLLGLLTLVWLSGQTLRAGAVQADNPYGPIVERNMFGLVAIPTNVPVDPTTLIPPPKITPNGIMTLFGKLQVLFKVAGVARPGLPPKDESYVMCAGDRQDEIEVQKIDEKSATITFVNHGVVQELALVASSPSGGAPPPGAPGQQPPPGFPPGMVPGGPGGGAPIGFGGRFGRNRGVSSGGNPNAGGGAPGLGASTTPGAGGAAAEEAPLETKIIMMEANRMMTQDAVTKGEMPPIPPTELTPDDATGIGGGALVAPPKTPGAGGGPGAPGGP